MNEMSQKCKKSTKVNPRENVPNFETNIPQVAELEKEAPKANFNWSKLKKIESFRETTLRGALENAYKVQI